MSHKHNEHDPQLRIKTPLWKWLVFLLIVVSMPVFFMKYRLQQTERAVAQTTNAPQLKQP